jgi:hypothetical protein
MMKVLIDIFGMPHKPANLDLEGQLINVINRGYILDGRGDLSLGSESSKTYWEDQMTLNNFSKI